MRLIASALFLLSTVAAAETPKPNASLAARAAEIVKGATGSVGFSVLHIETGQLTEIHGTTAQPLYSVFKLPVAIAVLREAAAGRIDLEKKIHVKPSEALVGGSKVNDERWSHPVDATVRELIGWSIVHSDNTSVDKLLELLGGTAPVNRTMTELGFPGIQVKASVRATRGMKGPYPNVANADDLARLLAALHQGKLLQEPQRDVLLGFMNDAVTGLARIRGRLPEGTKAGDKTGTGPDTANDVGIVTLPGNSGHLAIAVLVTRGKGMESMEKTIADLSRAAYDAYVPWSARAKEPTR